MSCVVAKRAHIILTGVVQGVGFRMYAQRQARSLGLRGYVRNLPDGGVEMVAEGDDAAVERLIAWARVGPPSAEVDDVRVTYQPTEGFGGFDIRM
jgi:acylphosphatase